MALSDKQNDIPAEFWLNLQAQYEVDTKNIALRDEKEREAFNIEKMLTNIICPLWDRIIIKSPALWLQKGSVTGRVPVDKLKSHLEKAMSKSQAKAK